MLKNKILKIFVCCLCSVFITLVFVLWQLQSVTGSASGALKFLHAMQIIQQHFNGTIDSGKMFEGAIAGMVQSLDDPYTVYMDAENFSALQEMTGGTFGGIGIVFGKRENEYVVISALPDNPGALAGIKSGDVIIAVDGKAASEMNMEEIAAKIRGPQGTEVELRLRSSNNEEKHVRVQRSEIKNPSVGGEMLPQTDIAYIRIAVFNENTGADFAKKYRELEKQGMRALLLDLRGNPGGVFDDGVAVAKMLVPKGPIVSVIDRQGNSFTENSSLEKVKYPLAVLVDHGTASAAEIVAGAVKDRQAGRLFGVKTFGKGSVQGVYRLDGETAVKVTNAKYYTPSGSSIHNIGIEPDEKVELIADTGSDEQFNAAKNYLLQVLQARKEAQ